MGGKGKERKEREGPAPLRKFLDPPLPNDGISIESDTWFTVTGKAANGCRNGTQENAAHK